MKPAAALLAAFVLGVIGYFMGLLLMVPKSSDQAIVIGYALLFAPIFGLVALLAALASMKWAKQSASFALIVAAAVGLASTPLLMVMFKSSDQRSLRAAKEKRLEENRRSLQAFWNEGFPKLQGFEPGDNYGGHELASAILEGKESVRDTCRKVNSSLGKGWDEISLSDSCLFGRIQGGNAETIQVSTGTKIIDNRTTEERTIVAFRKATQVQLAYRQLDTIVRAFKKQNWEDLEKLQTRFMTKTGGLRKFFAEHPPEESSYDHGRIWANTPGTAQRLPMRVTIAASAKKAENPNLKPNQVPVIVLTLRTENGLWRVISAEVMPIFEFHEKLQ